MIPAMQRTNASHMLSRAVRHLTGWMPRNDPPGTGDEWVDSDASWHNSSFDLAHGLVVIELFDERRAAPEFADTMPAFHESQPAAQVLPHR
jgi:hypothetical protein